MCNQQDAKDKTQRIASGEVAGDCCAEVAVLRGNA